MKVNVYLCVLKLVVGDYWMCCITCVITEIVSYRGSYSVLLITLGKGVIPLF